ncbi:hypothetical protein EJB05_27319, partial [Eragrostis curvula]
MRHTSTKLLFLVICSFFLILARAQQQPKPTDDNTANSCIPRERNALLAFKEGITNDTYNMLASWRRGQDCCQWRGVTCSNRSGHVMKLDLRGSLGYEEDPQYLVGQISPSLLSLEHLEYLDLSSNFLTWRNDSVPEFLGSMKNLRHLDLSNMNFSGGVSSFLGNLSYLEYLDLSWSFWYLSNLSYSPEFICSMTNLRHLGLSGMPFTGILPSSIGNLTNLEFLGLSTSSFSGIVPPQLGNLSNLQHLDLSFMDLYSTDISWLSHLHLLEYLHMSVVNLSAAVGWPHVINTLPSLDTLRLVDCLLPSANQSLMHLNLTNLDKLDLSFNNFHHPVASCWFWNLTNMKELNLSGSNLYGPFPTELGRMTGLKLLDFSFNGNTAMMLVDLKDLCALEILWLDESLASGNITELVENLPRCPSNKLQSLSLGGNNITGILPDRLNHLTGLDTLNLYNNSISGAIPQEIGTCTSLRAVYLSYNNLTGAIPQGIGNCTSLRSIYLSHNNLTGAIPTGIHVPGTGSENCKSLLWIDLSNNHFTGAIPPEIGNNTCLAYLNLSKNLLTGPIHPVLWNNLPSLYKLDLSNNDLTETIPPGIGNHTNLWYLDLSNNLIESIQPMSENKFTSLSYLDLSFNRLSGVIPLGIGNLTSLETLILHSNQLTGQMPPLPRSLVVLDISKNLLSGPLPLDFRAPNIKVLTLFSNQISGHIPRSICGLQNMLVLDLSNNSMEGKLPSCFPMPNIVFLLLNNNRFLGKLPPSFQRCSSLAFLDLAWNNFYGTLPIWIGNLMNMQFLQLSHNMFYGDIPVSITNLRRLRHLNLASNSLSGDIPWMLSNLTAMTKNHWKKRGVNMFRWYKKRVGEFEEVIPVVMKQQELNYGFEIFEVVAIDLSHNHLTGGIPNEVTSLNRLMNLNLSWNLLSGNIPVNVGHMESVVSLDLSWNNISGQIPSSLSELSYLEKLDLSYNNLTGTIPSGRQLDTLYIENPSMYDGNNGLCGPPLRRNCSGNNAPETSTQNTRAKFSEHMFFYFGLGSGFTVGLWIVFCAMLFKKTWRISYFRHFDRVYDKIYVFVVVTWGKKD